MVRVPNSAGDATGGGRRPVAAVALAAVLVLAGCAAPVSSPGRPDPAFDRLGWENGYWYDDPVDVNVTDGLNASEREAVVARAMARIERIRGLEFTRPVPVNVISRARYRNRSGGRERSAAYRAWNNQVWEALLIVGEDRDVSEAFRSTLSTAVVGFYSNGNITLVSDSPTPQVDRGTLVHELVHALQAQQLGFGPARDTQDGQLARDGVIEGEANHLQRLYERRCGREWDCIPRPTRSASAGGSFDMGVFVTVFTPYSEGPGFIEAVRDRGGWSAVDDLYERVPESTEQVIHPEAYPDERPENATVADRSSAAWSRFDLDRPAHDTAGEASIYAMLSTNGAVGGDHPTFEYDHPLSAGWAGDRIVPYRNGDRYGYVWRIVWDTEADAREFAAAYRAVLDERASRRPGPDVYVLPEDDPFGDAFRVRRNGRSVRIVNGPTVRALDGIGGTDGGRASVRGGG